MGASFGRTKALSEQLTDRQIEIVKNTWQRYLAVDLELTGMVIFTRLFKTEPSVQPLFLRLATNKGAKKLNFDQDMLRHHAIRVMEAFGAAVESLDNTDNLAQVLQSLGGTHIHYNVRPEMVQKLWPSIRYGLQQTLGKEYNGEVEQAWRSVFFYIAKHMKEGMTKELDSME